MRENRWMPRKLVTPDGPRTIQQVNIGNGGIARWTIHSAAGVLFPSHPAKLCSVSDFSF